MENISSHLKIAFHNYFKPIAMILFFTVICLAAALIWNKLLYSWPLAFSLILIVCFGIILYRLFNPLSRWLDKVTGRRSGSGTDHPGETMADISLQIKNVLDLDQLIDTLLSRLADVLMAKQLSLLVVKDGEFTSCLTPYQIENPFSKPVVLKADGRIVRWLDQESRILTWEMIDIKRDIDEEERKGLEAAGIALLCPLKNQKKLIAILALSQKSTDCKYSQQDLENLTALSSEAAPVIENALLFRTARQKANTDELTGLFNQGYFHQRIEEEIARSTRFGEIFSLIFLDIDNFKHYNDISGHLAGDQILKSIGDFIRGNLRESDLCFRYGGDEFAIVLPKTSLDSSHYVAERILEGIPLQDNGTDVPLTVSMGIASWPTDGVLKDDLIRSADAALYHSKQTGKNRINIACEVTLSEVFRIESAINQKNQDSGALLKTIFTLAATVDAKDSCTTDHSKNVTLYATEIARALGSSEESLERIRVAALLHDIGKIGIPDRILTKKGLLTLDEREIMQAHPNLGVSIIQHVSSLRECLAGIQYHHENYNGTGYPSGLKGNNIPLDARILRLADAFDAMTSPRLYRRAFSFEEALDELKNCSGTQFDPEIVEVFLQLKRTPKLSSPVIGSEG